MAPTAQPDPRSDLQLVDAINQGDAEAFEALYLRHRGYALRLAMRFCGERSLALDAVQDSFVYVLKKFPGFTLTAKFTTFLYPVVKHNALSAKAKAKRAQGVRPAAGSRGRKFRGFPGAGGMRWGSILMNGRWTPHATSPTRPGPVSRG